MNLPQDLQELLEQYLNGQLIGEALHNFEERIATDKELAAEVAFQKEMQAFLADTPENELRRNLQMLSDQVVEPKEEEDKGWFWWLFPAGDSNILDWLFGHPARHLAWLLPLLLVAGWWGINKNEGDIIDPPIVEIDTLKKENLIKIDTTRNIAVDPIQPIDTPQRAPKIIPEKVKQKDPTPVVQQKTAPTPAKTEAPSIIPHLEVPEILSAPPESEGKIVEVPGPTRAYDFMTPPTIYWYDSEVEPKIDFFDPNIYFGASPSMDSLMIVARQGGIYNIEVVEAPKVIYLAKNASQNDADLKEAPLKLMIEVEEGNFMEDLVLYVKDNQGNPFGPFPLSENMQFDGAYSYFVEMQLPLWDNTPRLVYYSIEGYDSKKTYFIDKIEVLPIDSIFEKRDFPMNGGIINLADLSFRKFEPDDIPDFFAPDTRLEAAIAKNPTSDDFSISIKPTIPDTFYLPDSLLVSDNSLSDSVQASRQAYLDSLFTFQIAVHSRENLFEERFYYRTLDNVNYLVARDYDGSYAVKQKYGTNTYFRDLCIGYASDYPEGLYYYQIVAGSHTFTGKYVILPISTQD